MLVLHCGMHCSMPFSMRGLGCCVPRCADSQVDTLGPVLPLQKVHAGAAAARRSRLGPDPSGPPGANRCVAGEAAAPRIARQYLDHQVPHLAVARVCVLLTRLARPDYPTQQLRYPFQGHDTLPQLHELRLPQGQLGHKHATVCRQHPVPELADSYAGKQSVW